MNDKNNELIFFAFGSGIFFEWFLMHEGTGYYFNSPQLSAANWFAGIIMIICAFMYVFQHRD